jgi:hypothetical protein
MPDDPVEVLRRWEDHGAAWRVEELTDDRAVVLLCICDGEPVDRLESGDAALIDYLRTRRPRAP